MAARSAPPPFPSWPGATLVAALALAPVAAQAEPLRVLAAGATESVLRASASGYEAQAGLSLAVTYGAVGLLRDKLLAGEEADLVIATPPVLEALQAKGLLRAGAEQELGRVGGGIAVRAGAERPAAGTPEELRRALAAAEEVHIADPATATAGAHFLAVADSLGIGAEVRKKLRLAPGGKQAMQAMARSTGRALGFTQVSEILSVPEVTLLGPYPASLQKVTVYAGAALSRSPRREAAEALLRHLRSPEVAERFRRAGFEVPAGR